MADRTTGGALEFSRPRMSHILLREGQTRFDESADEGERAALAALFDAQGVERFRFSGSVRPSGSDGLVLEGRLRATVVQSCVVSLDPVPALIDETVRRVYDPKLDPEQVEFDAGEDEEVEAMPRTLDLGLVAIEVAALALPPYPRADGAETGAPDPAPEEEEGRKPFAALAALRAKMDGGD